MKHQFFIAIFFSFWVSHIAHAGPEVSLPPTVYLEPGASKIITIRESGNLKLSRRGIVHIEAAGEKSWLVTAIASGLVAIKAVDQEKSHLVLLIKVQREEANTRPNSPNTGGHRPEQYALPGVETKKIHTLAALLQHFSRCLSLSNPCMKLMALSEGVKEEWRKYLRQKLGPGFSTIFFDEHTRIEAFCPPFDEKGLLDYLGGQFPGSLESGLLSAACRPMEKTNYLATGKFMLMERNQRESAGFNFFGESGKSEVLSAKERTYWHTLDFKDTLARAQAVTEPEISLTAGNEAYLESGGELLLSAIDPQQNDRKLNIWKSYGVSMRLKVFPLSEDKVELIYQIRIKNPDFSSGGQNLTGSEIKNTTYAYLGKPAYLGKLNFATNHDFKNREGILSQIPIIGPVFRHTNENKLDMDLSAWLTLEKLP